MNDTRFVERITTPTRPFPLFHRGKVFGGPIVPSFFTTPTFSTTPPTNTVCHYYLSHCYPWVPSSAPFPLRPEGSVGWTGKRTHGENNTQKDPLRTPVTTRPEPRLSDRSGLREIPNPCGVRSEQELRDVSPTLGTGITVEETTTDGRI